MRQPSTETVDKAVCTEESGAARLEAVLLALVERKARALHAEHARRTHPLLLLLRDRATDEEASFVGSSGEVLPSHWCEHEISRHKHKKLKYGDLKSSELLEMERRRRRRRRRSHNAHKPPKHRTLLVSAIDEQAKVIHVLDPDELPRRARYTIMVTACLLLFLCLMLVGVTLRMAPLIDDMGAPHRLRRHHSSAAECDRARRSRRHTLELPESRGPSVRSRSPEPPPPPLEPEVLPDAAGKEARRRRVVAAVAASFFALALASVLVVVVTLTHSSVLRSHNQTAKYYTFSVPPHHPLIRQENERLMHDVLQAGVLNRTQSSAGLH